MGNWKRWIYIEPFEDIESYSKLMEDVYKHAKRDYLFFSFYVFYVKRFLNNDDVNENFRKTVFQLLYDLCTIKGVKIYFVNEKTMREAKWSSIDELKDIISEVDMQWKAIKYTFPEVNQIIWLTS